MNGVFDPSVFDVGVRPKTRGTPVHDLFSDVRWSATTHSSVKRPRGAKRLGLAYERRVLDVLSAIYGDRFVAQPAIQYSFRQKRRLAILDGILRIADMALVIEVKLSHTERIWEQLVVRYAALVRQLEPGREVRLVEICRSYDPAVQLPGPHTKITSLHKPGSGLEVLQWRI